MFRRKPIRRQIFNHKEKHAQPTNDREVTRHAYAGHGRCIHPATGRTAKQSLSFEERFALLVDRQWNWRQNRALERRLKEGRLQGAACFEDIDFRAARGLDKQVVRSLAQDSAWVERHQHIFLVGPTGIGKTFLARAFGQKACRDGFTAYFVNAAQLFREIGSAGGSWNV
jgi:DNA replication protein DnaC